MRSAFRLCSQVTPFKIEANQEEQTFIRTVKAYLLQLYDLVRSKQASLAYAYLQRLFVFNKDFDLGIVVIVR